MQYMLPPPNIIPHERLEIFEISPQTIKDVFDGPDTSKASGSDLMSPRLQKEGSFILVEPFNPLGKKKMSQQYTKMMIGQNL